MPLAEYLRRQAETCLRIARNCFDLGSAERMRLLAGELNAKAHEIERQEGAEPRPYTWNTPPSRTNRGN